MSDENKGVPCLCGHNVEIDHGQFGCDFGCDHRYCETGEPALRVDVVQELDEHGIPWL